MCDLLNYNDYWHDCHCDINDREIERLWEELEDVSVNENECLDVDWRGWQKGTHREEIWYWFDKHHTKGVGWLMNEHEPERYR